MVPLAALDFACAETLGRTGIARLRNARKSRCCGVVIIWRFLHPLCCPPQGVWHHPFSDAPCNCGLLTVCGGCPARRYATRLAQGMPGPDGHKPPRRDPFPIPGGADGHRPVAANSHASALLALPSLHTGLALAARAAAKPWVRAQALGRRLWGGGRRFDRFLPELLRRLEGLAALAQVAPQICVLGEFLRRWSCFFA